MSQSPEYVLGTHDDEVTRLGLQHQLWAAYTAALWERAGFQPGSRLLDVGCGPGHAAFDLAQLVGPGGQVVAIDESPRFVEALRVQCRQRGLSQVDARVVDAQRLDLPAGSMDGAYCRWVLCWLRDAQAVIDGVARALRVGGVFAIQDYFNYRSLTLAPRSPELERVVQAVLAAWKMRGGDDDLAARLPAMLTRSGLRVREIHPVLRVARPGEPLWHWPTTFFNNFVPSLVKTGYLSQSEADAFFAEWRRRTEDANTFFCTPPVFEVIAVRDR
ncbi:MAG: methyltransferase domain-containing protein [Phycisphaerae bacterium]